MSDINKAVDFAVEIANDDSHGYSQYNRTGNPDYDCSSLVIAALKAGGFDTGEATYTGNMLAPLLRAGFRDVRSLCVMPTGAGLQKGDILLNVLHHTAIFIGNGQIAQASIDENGQIGQHAIAGDQTRKEILVRDYYNYSQGWDYVLRAPAAAPVLSVDRIVYVKGINTPSSGLWRRHTPAVIDGNTIDEIVAPFWADGITEDGWLRVESGGWVEACYCVAQTAGQLPIVSYQAISWRCARVLRFTKPRQTGEDVRHLQTALTDAGVSCGGVDGDFGGMTDEGVRAYQAAHRLDIDGEAGEQTITSLGGTWTGN